MNSTYDISSKGLSPDYVDQLLTHLFQNNYSVLQLSRNNFQAVGATKIAQCIPDLNIVELDLSNNDIKDEGAKAIAMALVNVKTVLRVVKLGFNNITKDGCFALVGALLQNPLNHVNELNLRYNCVGVEGARAVSVLLANPNNCSHLHTVDLTGNKILDSGLCYLSNAIGVNKTLKNLILWGNEITDAGMGPLCENLKKNSSLRVLDLSSNQITKEGLLKLYDAVKDNKNLVEIKLSGNEVNDRELLNKFKELCHRNAKSYQHELELIEKVSKDDQQITKDLKPVFLNPELVPRPIDPFAELEKLAAEFEKYKKEKEDEVTVMGMTYLW